MIRCIAAAGLLAFATVGSAQTVFSNASAISIPSGGQAAPYPSTIGVAGPGVTISNVVVTLKGFTHPRGTDVDMVLVGPGGQVCVVMSDTGADAAVSNLDLTFSRTGRELKAGQAITSGTFAPMNFGATLENFPGPGPGIVSNVDLAIFDGTSSAGTWSLYLLDDTTGPGSTAGSIEGGWTIRFNDPIVEAVQSSTQFSYQGVLKRDGAPYSGNADLRFSLWNSATEASPGAQFGSAQTLPGVAVSQGVFSVLLDFGAGAFGEQQRFLQVEARTPADGANFVAILPRTVLTGVPFAGVAPLAKSANQLDAPDGSPTAIVTVDNFGFAEVNSSLDVSGNLDVGFALTVGSAINANGGITLPTTTRTRIVAPSAWSPVSSSMQYAIGTGDRMTGVAAGTAIAFYVALDLPQDAVLTGVTVLYLDSAADQNISFALRRVLNNGNSSTNVATFTSTGTPGATSFVSPALSDPVNAASYAHQVVASWTTPTSVTQIRLGSIVVSYTVTSPLP